MTPRLLPYSPERDVYRLLDVPSSASIEEITAACRRLARTFHPDLNGSGRATEEMQVVNVVRQVMSDPEWRATYDRERYRFHAAMSQPTEPMLHSWPPMSGRAARSRSPFVRYLRATAAALRVTAGGLARPRCRHCRMVIPSTDAYCVACGTPLLPGGRISTG
jgi:curved DNA-binding protein CbpA